MVQHIKSPTLLLHPSLPKIYTTHSFNKLCEYPLAVGQWSSKLRAYILVAAVNTYCRSCKNFTWTCFFFFGNVNSWDVGSPDKMTHSILSLWSVHLHNNCVIWEVIINHFCAKFFSWSMEKSFVCVRPWSLIISCTTNQLNCQKRLRKQTIFQWHCNTLKIFWSWLCMCHLGWSKVNGWGNDGTS